MAEFISTINWVDITTKEELAASRDKYIILKFCADKYLSAPYATHIKYGHVEHAPNCITMYKTTFVGTELPECELFTGNVDTTQAVKMPKCLQFRGSCVILPDLPVCSSLEVDAIADSINSKIHDSVKSVVSRSRGLASESYGHWQFDWLTFYDDVWIGTKKQEDLSLQSSMPIPIPAYKFNRNPTKELLFPRSDIPVDIWYYNDKANCAVADKLLKEYPSNDYFTITTPCAFASKVTTASENFKFGKRRVAYVEIRRDGGMRYQVRITTCDTNMIDDWMFRMVNIADGTVVHATIKTPMELKKATMFDETSCKSVQTKLEMLNMDFTYYGEDQCAVMYNKGEPLTQSQFQSFIEAIHLMSATTKSS